MPLANAGGSPPVPKNKNSGVREMSSPPGLWLAGRAGSCEQRGRGGSEPALVDRRASGSEYHNFAAPLRFVLADDVLVDSWTPARRLHPDGWSADLFRPTKGPEPFLLRSYYTPQCDECQSHCTLRSGAASRDFDAVPRKSQRCPSPALVTDTN
jgi:hypothetical protein